jgi:hypothetical protein
MLTIALVALAVAASGVLPSTVPTDSQNPRPAVAMEPATQATQTPRDASKVGRAVTPTTPTAPLPTSAPLPGVDGGPAPRSAPLPGVGGGPAPRPSPVATSPAKPEIVSGGWDLLDILEYPACTCSMDCFVTSVSFTFENATSATLSWSIPGAPAADGSKAMVPGPYPREWTGTLGPFPDGTLPNGAQAAVAFSVAARGPGGSVSSAEGSKILHSASQSYARFGCP